ncbi:MAG TPA: hypothetical protein VHL52_08340 [Acidimicrobiia bacterium]|nr:hypothetical protein [Acidimicrobiia bacterium]
MADNQTTDHDEIRRWAEARDATPSVVKDTHDEEGSGILRFDMPGYDGGDNLEEVSWDEFFEIFDDRELAMIYQEETADGETSYFSKFVSR